MTVRTSVLWKMIIHIVKKLPGMVVQRTFIKEHSFVYRLYIIKCFRFVFSKCTYVHISEFYHTLFKWLGMYLILRFKRKPGNINRIDSIFENYKKNLWLHKHSMQNSFSLMSQNVTHCLHFILFLWVTRKPGSISGTESIFEKYNKTPVNNKNILRKLLLFDVAKYAYVILDSITQCLRDLLVFVSHT